MKAKPRIRPHRLLLYVDPSGLDTFLVIESWEGRECQGEPYQCASVMGGGRETNPEYKKMAAVGRGLVLWEGFLDPIEDNGEEDRIEGAYRRLTPEELAAIAQGRKPEFKEPQP